MNDKIMFFNKFLINIIIINYTLFFLSIYSFILTQLIEYIIFLIQASNFYKNKILLIMIQFIIIITTHIITILLF